MAIDNWFITEIVMSDPENEKGETPVMFHSPDHKKTKIDKSYGKKSLGPADVAQKKMDDQSVLIVIFWFPYQFICIWKSGHYGYF